MTSKARAAFQLVKKKLGFRYVMDVIPLEAGLIKGSHGSPFVDPRYYPVLIGSHKEVETLPLQATSVYDAVWSALIG